MLVESDLHGPFLVFFRTPPVHCCVGNKPDGSTAWKKTGDPRVQVDNGDFCGSVSATRLGQFERGAARSRISAPQPTRSGWPYETETANENL